MSEALAAIKSQARRVQRLEGQARQERDALYDLFRAAREQGVTLRAIAEAAGVTFKRVHQVVSPPVA